VEVQCDYSPGVCSEGGTGVVVAKTEGTFYIRIVIASCNIKQTLTLCLGLVTVKYIYGPATVSSSKDAVIGSSISGRLEAGITLSRLTTINMPMKGRIGTPARTHSNQILFGMLLIV
jgi:hypothetical protein